MDKGLAPVKDTALFWRDESGEIQYAGYTVVFIFFVRSEVTESGHGVPLFRMVPAGQPLWKDFFSFSSENTIHKWIFAEELFIVSQKFRTAQHQAGFGEQCFYSGSDMHQLLMVEKPGGCGKDVGSVAVDLIDNHSCIFVDGGRYDFPFYRRVCHDLCM